MLPLAHVGSGTFEPLQLLPLAVVAGAYVVRARTLARRGSAVPLWRQLCFAGGIALILAALVSPGAHLGEELVVAHMAQHLAMADLGALLFVLGLTGPMLQPLLANRWLGWLRVLGNPLVAFPLWALSLYVWHLPALYEGALTSEPLHALEHACFVGFGIAMWMALLGPLPKPEWFGNGARLTYIVGVRLTGAVLGNVFMWSGSVLYPDYAPGEAHWDISPLSDQGAAGVVMMVESGLVTLGLLTWVLLRWARETEERQELIELAEREGVALDPARAKRAVAAGEGERLRERIRKREATRPA
jgi:putative membrane protein